MSHCRSTRACSGVIYGIFQASQNFLPHFLWQSTTKSDLYPIMSVPTTQEREIWITSPLNWIPIAVAPSTLPSRPQSDIIWMMYTIRHECPICRAIYFLPKIFSSPYRPLPIITLLLSALSHILKVRKSQKEIVVSSITQVPQNTNKNIALFLFHLFQGIGQKLWI